MSIGDDPQAFYSGGHADQIQVVFALDDDWDFDAGLWWLEGRGGGRVDAWYTCRLPSLPRLS